MAGVLEYLCAEVLELGITVAEGRKRTRLQPNHLNLGIKSDEELSKLMCCMQVSKGGQASNVHESLLKKGKK